jgi:hypothetical protein
MKLKPEVKSAWLKALRGGEYKQGNRCLSTDIGQEVGESNLEFCCLGVLCDMAIKEGFVKGKWDLNQNFEANIDGQIVTMVSYPSYSLACLLLDDAPPAIPDLDDLTYFDPIVKIGKTEMNLSELNDEGILDLRYKEGVRKFGFKEIADIIEKQL